MSLKIKISKAEFEQLETTLQGLYIADGVDYRLDADYEDVSGLKNKNAELLEQLKKLKSKQIPDDFDLEAAKKALDDKAKADEDLALQRGEFEKVRKAIEDKAIAEKEELTSQLTNLRNSVAEQELTVELIKNGVFEEHASRMAKLLQLENIKPVQENGKTVCRSLDDTQTINLKEYIPTLKENYSIYYKATNTAGGGASGGQSDGSTIVNKSKMTSQEKSKFISENGKDAFLALPE